jgi:hypothetical protein
MAGFSTGIVVRARDFSPDKFAPASFALPVAKLKCKKEDFISKYKTEICKYYQSGNCRYGNE